MKVAHKYLVLASLYVVQSVPFSFVKTGFQLFLKDQNVDYAGITGITYTFLLPWIFKFLWAPLVDKWCANLFPKMRRALLFFQLLGASILAIIALLRFPQDISWVLVGLFVFSLVAATQDIIIDGFAVLLLPRKEHGLGNTFQMGGYYIGEVLGGALILIILDYYGWSWAMVSFVVFFLIPFVPVFLFKPKENKIIPKPSAAGFGDIRSFLKIKGVKFWLLVMMVFMGAQVASSTLLPVMFAEIDFNKTDIAILISLLGNSASVAGAILSGTFINKWGRKNSLVGFGILKMIAILSFLFINTDAHLATAYSVVMVNGFLSGLLTITLFTIMMDKCRLTSPGTDFTLQQSLNLTAIAFFGICSGFLVKYTNFTTLFVAAFFIGVVAILLAIFGISRTSLDKEVG